MIDYAVCCCQGQRSYNEDRVGISTEQGDCATFVLADGLGGHGMGDIASSLAVECSLSCAEDTRKPSPRFTGTGFGLMEYLGVSHSTPSTRSSLFLSG